MTATRRRAAGTLLALTLALTTPAAALAQTCIGNSAEIVRFSTVELSTGSVNLPQDVALHMAGITHHTDDALLGMGQNVYRVEYGAMTGIDNADDYDTYGFRASASWLFGLPLPAAAPSGLDVCWTLGTKFAGFGYIMRQQAIVNGETVPDQEVAAWYVSWGIPVTASAGYRIGLNDAFSLVPYVAPGLNAHYGGLLADADAAVGVDQEVNEVSGKIDYFTTMGVALNHDRFRVGLFVESGMAEAYGTRFGLEGGIAW